MIKFVVSIWLVFILLIPSALNSRHADRKDLPDPISPVEENAIYEFLNWFIIVNQIYTARVAETSLKWTEQEIRPIADLPDGTFSETNPFIFRGIERLLGEESLKSIYIQYKASKGRKWDPALVPRARMVDESITKALVSEKDRKEWSRFRKEYGSYLMLYSVPLFSSDQNYVLIKYEKLCGADCAEGCTIMYKRIPGRTWELFKTIKCFSLRNG